ncbi:MAG: class I SAM-dependent methyltransferase [Acidimicrobiales bacterium]
MERGPSRTAMGSAVLRAAHVRQDAPPWVLEDEVSESLLDEADRRRIRREVDGWPAEIRAAFRLVHAVRSRVAEDVAVAGLDEGRGAYVLLGAGLDSFAWRHPSASRFEIWEIDHPATQAWKRRALAARRLGEPGNVRFVPVDLAATSLADVATPSAATWSWLGVTMYLERATTTEVLRVVAAHDPGTTLVVNFVLADDRLDDLSRTVRATAADVVRRVGEPVRGTYRRSECEQMLHDAGFSSVELLDAATLAQRYFPGRPELALAGSTVLCVARV